MLMSKKLKHINYKGLKLINERLYASEGAFIDKFNIKNIETAPHNSYKLIDEKYKFLISCEILNIDIKNEKQALHNYVASFSSPRNLVEKILPPPYKSNKNNINISARNNFKNTKPIYGHPDIIKYKRQLAAQNAVTKHVNTIDFSNLKYFASFPDCHLSSDSTSGNLWINKFKNNLDNDSNIKIHLIKNIYNLKNNHHVILIDKNNLNDNEIAHIAQQQSLTTIIVSSFLDFLRLKDTIKNKKILRGGKIWPVVKYRDDNVAFASNYFLYLEKDPKITQVLFNVWKKEFGKLLVVGTRAKLPVFADYFSEYDSYNNLLGAIVKCKAVIDLSDNFNYYSGVLSLCKHINKAIITNNFRYFKEENHNIRYIIGSGQNLNNENLFNGLCRYISGNFITNINLNYRLNASMIKELLPQI